MSRGSRELARAIKGRIDDVEETRSLRAEYGEVVSESPLVVNITDSPIVLTEADLVVDVGTAGRGPQKGETIPLLAMPDGDWVTLGLVTDREMEEPGETPPHTHVVADITDFPTIPTTLPPSGSAGGVLDGSYPSPGLAASVAGGGLTETADVLSVGAGTGITVAADDISVDSSVLRNVLADAKGDLLVASAADALTRLGVGTNGQVLTADSAEATGVKWAAAGGGGAPSGAAGGGLGGTYPNPEIASGVAGAGLAHNTATSPDSLDVSTGTGLEISSDTVRIATAAAGAGLTGGGGSALDVATGTGLEISSDTVRIAAAAAGSGLTGGAGSALAVGAGTGISVAADTVGVDSSVLRNVLVDAKGDLLVGTAADTVTRLAPGTDGHVLTADSTLTEGVKWAAAAGGGAPSGTAGGALDGTYPNPGIAASVAGAGLTETTNVLAVGAGDGISVAADAVAVASDVARKNIDNAFTDTQTITDASGGLLVRSGGAASFATIALGRTATDVGLGVAGATNNFFTGTAAGDGALRQEAGALHIGAGTTGAAELKVADAALTATAPLAMSSQKITGLANGTVSTDAVAYGQLTAAEAAAIPKALVDVKGDLIAATAADTVARLAVGTDAQQLTADSATSSGLRWITPRTVDPKSPLYDAVGDNSTDDSTAIQNAMTDAAAAGADMFLPGGTFICELVEMPDNLILRGSGTLKHKAGTAAYCISCPSTTSGAVIEGITVDGNGNNVTNANARPIWIDGTQNVVRGVRVYDGRDHAIFLDDGATFITVQGCLIHQVNGVAGFPGIATGRHGIGLGSVSHCLIEGNQTQNTNQHGVGHDDSAASVQTHVTVANNVIYNPVGAGTGDGIGLYHNANEHVHAVGNNIYSPGNNGIHVGGTNPMVSDNTIKDAGVRGILIQSDPNSGPTDREGFVCANNLIDGVVDTTLEGLRIGFTSNGVVSGNVVRNALGDYAIRLVESHDITVAGNLADSPSVVHGIMIDSSKRAAIVGNRVNGSTNRGITFADDTVTITEDCICNANVITDCTGSAFRLQDSADSISFGVNTVRSCTAIVSLSGTAPTTHRFATQNTDESDSVARAATIALPIGHDIVEITGDSATPITAITGTPHAGRTVTLIFASTAQVTDGGNLLLSANSTGAANRTLTIQRRGSNWYEVARSTN